MNTYALMKDERYHASGLSTASLKFHSGLGIPFFMAAHKKVIEGSKRYIRDSE